MSNPSSKPFEIGNQLLHRKKRTRVQLALLDPEYTVFGAMRGDATYVTLKGTKLSTWRMAKNGRFERIDKVQTDLLAWGKPVVSELVSAQEDSVFCVARRAVALVSTKTGLILFRQEKVTSVLTLDATFALAKTDQSIELWLFGQTQPSFVYRPTVDPSSVLHLRPNLLGTDASPTQTPGVPSTFLYYDSLAFRPTLTTWNLKTREIAQTFDFPLEFPVLDTEMHPHPLGWIAQRNAELHFVRAKDNRFFKLNLPNCNSYRLVLKTTPTGCFAIGSSGFAASIHFVEHLDGESPTVRFFKHVRLDPRHGNPMAFCQSSFDNHYECPDPSTLLIYNTKDRHAQILSFQRIPRFLFYSCLSSSLCALTPILRQNSLVVLSTRVLSRHYPLERSWRDVLPTELFQGCVDEMNYRVVAQRPSVQKIVKIHDARISGAGEQFCVEWNDATLPLSWIAASKLKKTKLFAEFRKTNPPLERPSKKQKTTDDWRILRK